MNNPDPTINNIAVVEHTQFLPFLRSNLKLNSIWGASYWLFNIITFVLLIYNFIQVKIKIDMLLQSIGLGMVLFFVLIPIHEVIHAAAYKIFGAPHLSFAGNWKKGVVYALADQFVIGRKKFIAVALAPFVIINLLLIVLILYLPFSSSVILWVAMISHMTACFGDFALVSFMHQHRHRNIVTMDDVKEGKTYFFEI